MGLSQVPLTSSSTVQPWVSVASIFCTLPLRRRSASTLKRLVQSPNSFFMDVKCPGCFHITPVFSHAQIVVFCSACSTALCQPTGGRCRLTEGCSYRKKVDA